MQTAEQVTSNSGNPALGGGFTPQGVPFVNTDPLADFHQTLKQLQGENFQWNAKMYDQKVQDRDKLMETMAGNKIDGDVLDDDRKVLQQSLDSIKDIMLKDPQKVFTDPTTYAKFNQANQQFKTQAAAAKTRYNLIKGIQDEAAKETNPTVREDMDKYVRDNIAGGINHIPNPYPKLYTYDPNKTWINLPVPTKVVGYESKNGIGYEKQQTKGDQAWLKQVYDYYTGPNIMANNQELLNQIQISSKGLQSPNFANKNNIEGLNTQLAKINQDLALTPNDPRFLQPIGQVADDGTVTLNQDPVRLAYQMAVLKNYVNKVESVPSKDAQKALLEKSQATENYAQAGAASAQAKKTLELLPFEKEKMQAEVDKLKEQSGINANEAVDASNNTFRDISNSKDLKTLGKTLDVNVLAKGLNTPLSISLEKLGIPEGSEYTQIPVTNGAARKMLSEPDVDKNGRRTGIGKKPAYMFAVKKPDGSLMLIGVNDKGEVGKTINNAEEGATEYINADMGYSGKDQLKIKTSLGKIYQTINSSQNNQQQQQNNNNNTPIKDYEDAREINGATYYKKAGKWYDGSGKVLGDAK